MSLRSAAAARIVVVVTALSVGALSALYAMEARAEGIAPDPGRRTACAEGRALMAATLAYSESLVSPEPGQQEAWGAFASAVKTSAGEIDRVCAEPSSSPGPADVRERLERMRKTCRCDGGDVRRDGESLCRDRSPPDSGATRGPRPKRFSRRRPFLTPFRRRARRRRILPPAGRRDAAPRPGSSREFLPSSCQTALHDRARVPARPQALDRRIWRARASHRACLRSRRLGRVRSRLAGELLARAGPGTVQTLCCRAGIASIPVRSGGTPLGLHGQDRGRLSETDRENRGHSHRRAVQRGQ